MNILLWILQILLAVAFFAHGWLLLWPPPDIAAQMNAELPRWFWVVLGIAEIAAAFGITLPGLTKSLPWLVVWSAVGIAFVMVSATIWHVVRTEYSSALITLVLLVMASGVAWMRRRWQSSPHRSWPVAPGRPVQ